MNPFKRTINNGFGDSKLSLPRAGLLLYLGRPNLEAADVPVGDDTEIGDDTIIRWKFLLPADADIRAATGWVSGVGNIFYDAVGDPVDVFASEIADWADINRYNVLFHLVSADTETGRLAIYALGADHATLNKARRVLREDQYDYWAPLGAILHYDAEVAPLSELVGGVHTLNHAVLGPQYKRLADGSYVDVGAQPAVDVLTGGIKGLRTCRDITNLLPVGSDNLGTGLWIYSGGATYVSGGILDPFGGITAHQISIPVGGYAFKTGTSVVTGSVFYISIWVKGEAGKTTQIKSNLNSLSTWATLSAGWSGVGTSGATLLVTLTGEWQEITLIGVPAAPISSGVWLPLYVADRRSAGDADWLQVCRPIITATSYPVPYVPPGVTQPASSATTTNGIWFTNPDGSPLWQALTGSPFTLATRILMRVGSADLPIGGYQLVGTQTNLNLQYYANANIIAKSFDGVTSAQAILAWLRNATIQRFTQVNTAGTHFRVGYIIEGTHTTIQWSHPSEDSTTWAVFDGSFNPSTLYRFMLGYNNPYPMWFNKITAWKRQVPTTELGAWA